MRVVIAEDEALLREGLARVLQDAVFEVAGRCGDAEALLRMVEARKPDVAIVDIRMPPGHGDDGLVAAQAIRRHPDVGVLVFSHYLDSRYAGRLLARRGPGGRRTPQDCVITPWSAETAARGGRPSPAVDGLVADVPVRAVHKRAAQMLGDLLPPPLQLKLGLHQLAQFAVKGSACLVAGGGCAAEPGLGHTDNDIVVEVPDVVFVGPGRGGGATGLQRRVPTRLAIHIGQTRR